MKLKEIPRNTVVHTPTEAEACELLAILHENGYNFTPTYESLVEINRGCGYPSTMCFSFDRHHCIDHCDRSYYEELGYTILTLAEFKERYCEEEKPQPKFKVGDMAIFRGMDKPLPIHSIAGNCAYSWWDDGTIREASLVKHLKPYTDPETKPTEDMEAKGKESGETGNNSGISQSNNLSQDVANCDKPEDKQLNLCELLKGHEGERFYSLLYGETQLRKVGHECIEIATGDGKYWTSISSDGTFAEGGKVVLFPSRALYEQYPLDPYTAWMEWQEEQKKYSLSISYQKNYWCSTWLRR